MDGDGDVGRPQQLPRFTFQGIEYFADLRLGEFRAVYDLTNRMRFASPEGRQASNEAGIVRCRGCGTHAIVSTSMRNEGLRCMRCGQSMA